MTLKEECIYVVRHLVIPGLSFGMINAVVATIIEHEDLFERIVGLVLQTSDGYSDMWFLACMTSTHILFWVLVKLLSGATLQYS